MRPAPKDRDGQPVAVPEVKIKERPDYISQTREYELITPLFGGGVEPGVADPVTTIRATEIRGHLRFWWRATRGGQFGGDVEKMKEMEDAIFGAASSGDSSHESPVAIKVAIKNAGQAFSKDRSGRDIYHPQSDYGYAAFALRPTGERPTGAPELRRGVRFALKIEYPKKLEIKREKGSVQISAEKEIEAALWVWETFGGVGARTRRGFGSIKLLSVNGNAIAYPDNSYRINEQIGEKLAKYRDLEEFPDDVPQILHFQIYGRVKESEQVHLDLINLMKGFRQDRGGNKFGRSRWPEADEIRRLTKSGSPTKSNVRAFPRAYLGLPIMFEFASEKGLVPQTTLQWAQGTRLASPLILRPYPVGADKAIGLIVELDGTLGVVEDGLILIEGKKRHAVSADVPDAQVRAVAPFRGKDHAIDAFFEYVKDLSKEKGRR
ncbi:MAG TPA: type III-B CRISPR module RAMP protein Cmr1 [Blastocatellia bacterium]